MGTKRQELLSASKLLLAVSLVTGLVACSEKHEQERVQHFESLKELFEKEKLKELTEKEGTH